MKITSSNLCKHHLPKPEPDITGDPGHRMGTLRTCPQTKELHVPRERVFALGFWGSFRQVPGALLARWPKP